MLTVLLILASQRIETAAGGLLWGAAPHGEPLSRRGAPPSLVEWLILAWVSGRYPHHPRSPSRQRLLLHSQLICVSHVQVSSGVR